MQMMIDRTCIFIADISLAVSDRITSYLWSSIDWSSVSVRFTSSTHRIRDQELEDHARCSYYTIDLYRCPLLVRVDG